MSKSRTKRQVTSNRRPEARRPKRVARTFFTLLATAYLVAIVWTSWVYAAEYKSQPGPLSATSAPIRKATSAIAKRLDIRAYVQRAAKAQGVDPSAAEWIVYHESSHRPDVTGDGGESRGLWQINRVYHPEVSDRCAYDVKCSTDWSLQRIRDGNIDEWRTWKYRKRLALTASR